MTKGNSKDNAIVINALDSIAGVTEEHQYIDQLCSTLDTGVEAIDQSLIFENRKQYDKFVILLEDGREKILYFDISSLFGKI
jgi:hypothetical protein